MSSLLQERELGRTPELHEVFLATHSKRRRSEDGTTTTMPSEEVQSRAVTTNFSNLQLELAYFNY